MSDRNLKIDGLTANLSAESAAHRQTKLDYRAAQAEAVRLEQARLERAKAEQQEITDDVVADYRRRLADTRARAERLRRETGRAGERAAGARGGVDVPAPGDAAGRVDAPASDHRLSGAAAAELDWRLTATDQALQLDALIDWVERQAAVPVNEPAAP